MNDYQGLLSKNHAGRPIGHKIYFYEQTGSTNDDAFGLGSEGQPHGTVVIADTQTTGRGRMSRSWHSPPGANIYTSILLRPEFTPARAPQISIAAGVAVAETLHKYCPDKVQLKWPNDVLIAGKKICGILSQMKLSAEAIDFVVVGIGINVNMVKGQLPEELRETATSLSIETGHELARSELIICLFENMAKWYRKLTEEGFDPVKNKWLSLSPMIGWPVTVRFHDETISGRAAGLGDDGSLAVVTGSSETIFVSAGDATIIKKAEDYAAGH